MRVRCVERETPPVSAARPTCVNHVFSSYRFMIEFKCEIRQSRSTRRGKFFFSVVSRNIKKFSLRLTDRERKGGERERVCHFVPRGALTGGTFEMGKLFLCAP